MRTTYHVDVRREREWWVIIVPDLDHAVSQARDTAEIEPMARDLIAITREIEPDSFDLEVSLTN